MNIRFTKYYKHQKNSDKKLTTFNVEVYLSVFCMFIYLQQVFVCSISELNKLLCIKAIIVKVTVQPFISYIHKPASELSVAALQLMFTHFRNERLFYHKKVLNNTMNKLIVLPIIFLWLNCYNKRHNAICECCIISFIVIL